MYSHSFLFFIFYFLFFNISAQKEDYNWILGYDGHAGNALDTGIIKNWGNTFMYFDGNKMDTMRYWRSINFSRTHASISDANGDLLFYTNGIKVNSKVHSLMENGDSLNFGKMITDWDNIIFTDGYRNQEGAVIVNKPGSNQLFYIIHSRTGVNKDFNLYPEDILCTTIDLSYNNGIGKVITKNEKIIDNSTSQDIMVCRNSNGKDWWMLFQEVGTNCFYTVKIDSEGIQVLKEKQCLGQVSSKNDLTHSCFSPDGKKYIKISGYQGIYIFDFDRCSGKLSNPVYIDRKEINQSLQVGIGVAVSPTSKYLYVTHTDKLYQFDLTYKDILSSKILIDTFDGFNGLPYDTVFVAGTYFHIPQLAPDGKIYISTGNFTRYLHVIHDPDQPGKACNFKQHDFRLPTGSGGIPNFPNYRLGAMKCASDVVQIDKEKIKLFPNPVTSYAFLDYGFLDWSGEKQYRIELTNAIGQVVWERALPRYSGYQKIDMTTYNTGVYYISMKANSGNVLWQNKIMKQE